MLLLQKDVLKENFYISSTSLQELEHIKVSRNKEEQVKYAARKILHILDENETSYNVIVTDSKIIDIIAQHGLENTPDNQICACASTIEDVIFITNDIACKSIARHIFGLKTETVKEEEKDLYTGFIEKSLSETEMAYFYEHLQENIYDLLDNQYIIIKDQSDKVVDIMVWRDEMYQNVKFPTIRSNYFGSVKPLNGDIFQQMALNSFSNNQVTMIKGAAGTGKSYLAVGYLMWLLEKRKIEKIIVFCNTVATANSAKLGYYPGTKDEKLLDSSIGNMLSAKLGDSFGLEEMMAKGRIQLLPMSDIRGFDTNGMCAGIYITEAQNMDISLMKLALQRIGEDSVCIIDGDYNAQVDLSQYAGSNNGMRRMSEVFRGQDFYGEVELQNIYRSKIAKIAENM
nr:PhoH family protein [uncultured Lachnoclostridium sp.]